MSIKNVTVTTGTNFVTIALAFMEVDLIMCGVSSMILSRFKPHT